MCINAPHLVEPCRITQTQPRKQLYDVELSLRFPQVLRDELHQSRARQRMARRYEATYQQYPCANGRRVKSRLVLSEFEGIETARREECEFDREAAIRTVVHHPAELFEILRRPDRRGDVPGVNAGEILAEREAVGIVHAVVGVQGL